MTLLRPKRVFLDLDGVMVDLEKGLHHTIGRSYPKHLLGTSDFHEYVLEMYDDVQRVMPLVEFWATLPMMPGAIDLFNKIVELNGPPTILTATPKDFADYTEENRAASVGKTKWAHTFLHPSLRVITTRSNIKQHFIDPECDSILIDDYDANIARWKRAGGIPIHHTSNESSISKLNEMFGQQ